MTGDAARQRASFAARPTSQRLRVQMASVAAVAAAAWAVAAMALVAMGCGAGAVGAFGAGVPDNDPVRLARVLNALPLPADRAPAHPGGDELLVVAVTHAPQPELLAYGVRAGSVLWRLPIEPDSRPELFGDIVVASTRQGGGASARRPQSTPMRALVAFDAATGRSLWRSDTEGLAHLGSARSSETLIYSLGSGDFGRRKSVSAVKAVHARTGAELWQHRVEGRVGRPSVLGGFVFVPWDGQSLVVLHAQTGEERARIRLTDDVISWVRAAPEGVFFGDRGIYAFDVRAYSGRTNGATYLPPPLPGLPGDPPLQRSAFVSEPASRSARGRIAVLFTPDSQPDRRIGFAESRLYFVFLRYLFGLNPDGRPAWCRVLERDVVAARAVRGGIVAVDEGGQVRAFDANRGTPVLDRGIPAELASAALDTHGSPQGRSWAEALLQPPMPGPTGPATQGVAAGWQGGSTAPMQGSSEVSPARTLREQLLQVVADPDNRLVPARVFALHELAKLEASEVTQDLLDLGADRGMPEVLRQRAARALRERAGGERELLAALLKHYDFLEGTRPAPLSLVVPALVARQERAAVPRLVQHMLDPATPIQELPTVVSALVDLGDATVVEPLRSFLLLYRADSSFAGSPKALAIAAQGMLKHGGADARASLEELAQNPATLGPLATEIRALLAPAAVAAPLPSQPKEPAPGRPSEVEAALAALPHKLEREDIDATFAAHIDDLRSCVIEELGRNAKLAQVRIAFVLENDGTAHGFRFVPNTPGFIECLAPRVREYRFPAFRARRQLASYVVAVGPRATQDTPTAPPAPELQEAGTRPEADPKSWWAWHAARPAEMPEKAKKAGPEQSQKSPQTAAGRQPWWKPWAALASTAGETRTAKGHGAAGDKMRRGPDARPWWGLWDLPQGRGAPATQGAGKTVAEPKRSDPPSPVAQPAAGQRSEGQRKTSPESAHETAADQRATSPKGVPKAAVEPSPPEQRPEPQPGAPPKPGQAPEEQWWLPFVDDAGGATRR